MPRNKGPRLVLLKVKVHPKLKNAVNEAAEAVGLSTSSFVRSVLISTLRGPKSMTKRAPQPKPPQND